MLHECHDAATEILSDCDDNFTCFAFAIEILDRMRYPYDMEKRKPHYPLSRIRSLIERNAYRVTTTALNSAARDFRLFEAAEIAACVAGLDAKCFYKSMTVLHDSTLWQDVYRPEIQGMPAYVKIQIVDETTVVISFKLSENE